ncbi:UNVERIFIED_CONTAM: hypothetical protein GTU68_059450, partial [Idotea baltica]|nr:hypothetical protein [Idotea baltica]
VAITIGSNIASLRGIRQLNKSTRSLTDSFERLASGKRINKASDDAAGLGIADALRADARLTTTAQRNLSDGISAINILNSGLDSQKNILFRLGELAEQSANGVYSTEQRQALDEEYQALLLEFDRIGSTTEFNGVNLLRDKEGQDIVIQAGITGGADSLISLTKANSHRFAGVTGLISNLNNDGVATKLASRRALDTVTNRIEDLSALQGKYGSVQNRLEIAHNTLGVARENFKAAESRIRDVDVAEESSNLLRNNILQQAGAAVLAQANLQPSLALQLLS